MPKKYPELTLSEVEAILECWQFEKGRGAGSHRQWRKTHKGRKYIVTVDEGYGTFDEDIIASMIRQSGLTRDQFYAGSKSAARRAGVYPLKHAR